MANKELDVSTLDGDTIIATGFGLYAEIDMSVVSIRALCEMTGVLLASARIVDLRDDAVVDVVGVEEEDWEDE